MKMMELLPLKMYLFTHLKMHMGKIPLKHKDHFIWWALCINFVFFYYIASYKKYGINSTTQPWGIAVYLAA